MTWKKVVERDMKARGLLRNNAKGLGEQKTNSHNSGKNSLKIFVVVCCINTIIMKK